MKEALYLVLYQEIVCFMQHYCRTWGIQISGNKGFATFCYRLMDSLAVGQIYYMIQNALEYLHKHKALQPRNENFINTNLLKNPTTVSGTWLTGKMGNLYFTTPIQYPL